MKAVQRIHLRLYGGGKGIVVRFILLLTHTGRKSGTRYVTPLQYEKIDGAHCVCAARGSRADWYRNILADPHVYVQVDSCVFDCVAEPVADPGRVADFSGVPSEPSPAHDRLDHEIRPQAADASHPCSIPGVE